MEALPFYTLNVKLGPFTKVSLGNEYSPPIHMLIDADKGKVMSGFGF